jgi:hypothetical protein
MRQIVLFLFVLTACTDPMTVADAADAASLPAHHPHPDAAVPSPDAAPVPDAPPTPCGELGEACCTGDAFCNGGAHADIYCSTGGVCAAPVPNCGGESQACCNPLCDPTGACWTAPCEGNQECQAGACVVITTSGCGGQDQPCCTHPGTTITFCDLNLGLACDGEAPDGTRTCI